MRRLALAALLLASCGGEAPAPAPAPEADLYRTLCAALGRAELPPDTPARHFRMAGQVRFRTDSGAVVQDAELLLGGPDRLRFQAASGGARNVFAYDGADAWLLAPGAEDWSRNDGSLLAAETRLRWEAARFPWGWREVLVDAAAADADAGDGAALDAAARRFVRELPDGRLTAELARVDGALRPTALEFRPMAAAPVTVRLESWAAVDGGGGLQPLRMIWQDGARIEEWTEVSAGALFLGSAFRPPGNASGPLNLPGLAAEASDLGDRLDLREDTLWWMSAENYAARGAAARLQGHWWRVAGEQRFVPAEAPDGDAQLVPTTTRWLVWTRYATGTWTPDEDVLAQAMRQAGVVEDGARWRLDVPDDGRRRLHVLRIPVRAAGDPPPDGGR